MSWLTPYETPTVVGFSLTTEKGFMAADALPIHKRGAVFVITRKAENFLARWLSPILVYPCHGMREEASERALAAAFEKDNPRRVTRLYRRDDLPDEQCWLRAPGWSLAYE